MYILYIYYILNMLYIYNIHIYIFLDSDILSDTLSDILSDIPSGSLPGIHSIWDLFWHSFWQIFWHFLWHPNIISDIFSGILSSIMSGILFGVCSGPGVAHCIRSWRYGDRFRRGRRYSSEGVSEWRSCTFVKIKRPPPGRWRKMDQHGELIPP